MIRKSKFLPVLVLSIIIIVAFFSLFKLVNASSSSFSKKDSNWYNLSNKIDASQSTYPYGGDEVKETGQRIYTGPSTYTMQTNVSITKVSSYITYGTTKWLMGYMGELPYNNIRTNAGTDDEKIISGFSGYYSIDGTDMHADVNPDFKGGNSVPATDYWGIKINSEEFANKKEAEEINENGVVSLRLHANQNTFSNWFTFFIGNMFYYVALFVAWIATQLISLVVKAKNISLNFILDILQLDELSDQINQAFIIDENGHISIFFGVMVVVLIIEIVCFAVSYAKGGTKNKSISNIVITALIGFAIIGVAVSGKTNDLGTTAANFASKLMYTASESISDTGDGTFFKYQVTDSADSNKDITYSELSLIYKPYINAQICTQFGVQNIDQLKFENYGDANGTVAKETLAGVDNLKTEQDLLQDFNSNLGYYYWFANSSATQKVNDNVNLPTTAIGASENKLNSMITYLQKRYTNTTDSTVKSLIQTNIESLSNPDGNYHFLPILLLGLILFVLTFVLATYAIKVLKARLYLFVAILGFAFAGPMVLSNKDKWVKTGKQIVQMVLVSIIEITIWSIFFDLIIYVITFLLSEEILRLILVFVLLLLFYKLNFKIAKEVTRLLDNATRSMCPEYHTARASFESKVKSNKAKIDDFNNKQVVIGQDEAGNDIYGRRGDTKIGKILNFGANTLLADDRDHNTLIKDIKEQRKKSKEVKQDNYKQIKDKAKEKVDSIETTINEAKTKSENSVNEALSEAKAEYMAHIDKNTGKVINTVGNEEESKNKEIQEKLKHLEILKTNDEYLEIQRLKKEEPDKVTPELEEKFNEHNKKIEDNEKELSSLQKQIQDLVYARVRKTKLKSKLGDKLSDNQIDNLADNELAGAAFDQSFSSMKDQYLESLKYYEKACTNEYEKEGAIKRKLTKNKAVKAVVGNDQERLNKDRNYAKESSRIKLTIKAIEENTYDKDSFKNIEDKSGVIAENVVRNRHNIYDNGKPKDEQTKQERADNKLVKSTLKDNAKITNAGAKAQAGKVVKEATMDDQINFFVSHEDMAVNKNEVVKEKKENLEVKKPIRPWKDTVEKAEKASEIARNKKEENDRLLSESKDIIRSGKNVNDIDTKTEVAMAKKQRNISTVNSIFINHRAKSEDKRELKVKNKDIERQIKESEKRKNQTTNLNDIAHEEQVQQHWRNKQEELNNRTKNAPRTEKEQIDKTIDNFNPEMDELLNRPINDDYFDNLNFNTNDDDKKDE